jgi:hypothetical protein
MQPIRPVAPVPPYDPGPMPPRTTAFALVAIAAAALGVALIEIFPLLLLARFLAFGGMLCGLVALLLGTIALGRIARQPKRYEGKPMAVAAIIVGLLEVVGYIAFYLLGTQAHLGL